MSTQTTNTPSVPPGDAFMEVLMAAVINGCNAQSNGEVADANLAVNDSNLVSAEYDYWDGVLDQDTKNIDGDPKNTAYQQQYSTDSTKMNSNVGQSNTMAQNQENQAENVAQTEQQWTTMMSSPLDFMSKISGWIQQIIA